MPRGSKKSDGSMLILGGDTGKILSYQNADLMPNEIIVVSNNKHSIFENNQKSYPRLAAKGEADVIDPCTSHFEASLTLIQRCSIA
jgi:hypothetical protein